MSVKSVCRFTSNSMSDRKTLSHCSNSGGDFSQTFIMLLCFDSYEDVKIKLEATTIPGQQNENFYNMCHKNRGVAVILNHDSFAEDLDLDPRLGSDVDVKSLKKCLERLGFVVQVYLDLTVAEIDDVLEECKFLLW